VSWDAVLQCCWLSQRGCNARRTIAWAGRCTIIHSTLDIDHWKATFPLARERQGESELEVDFISGPRTIAVLEQLRDEVFGEASPLTRVPTDVFVWARGEPEQRAVTKIAGLPYRAAGKPWPTDACGRPRLFLAQFCFADSRDIALGPLPGDLLLVFAAVEEWQHGTYDFMWGRPDVLAFEWSQLGEGPLMSGDEVPALGMPLLPCYGIRYRTWDYALGSLRASDHAHLSSEQGEGKVESAALLEELWEDCAVVEGTKIGGIAPQLYDEYVIRLDREEQVPPGTYLCTLASLSVDIHRPFALLNLPDAVDFGELEISQAWEQSNPLMIADAGLLNFFVDTDGAVRWTGHCAT
jgi:Domain of unknown function (DUF1963)